MGLLKDPFANNIEGLRRTKGSNSKLSVLARALYPPTPRTWAFGFLCLYYASDFALQVTLTSIPMWWAIEMWVRT